MPIHGEPLMKKVNWLIFQSQQHTCAMKPNVVFKRFCFSAAAPPSPGVNLLAPSEDEVRAFQVRNMLGISLTEPQTHTYL